MIELMATLFPDPVADGRHFIKEQPVFFPIPLLDILPDLLRQRGACAARGDRDHEISALHNRGHNKAAFFRRHRHVDQHMPLPAGMRHKGVHFDRRRRGDHEELAGDIAFFVLFFEMRDLAGVGELVQFWRERGAYDRYLGPGFKERERLALCHRTAADDHAGPIAKIQVCGIIFHGMCSFWIWDSAVFFMAGCRLA